MRQDRKKTPLRELATYGDSRAVRDPDCDYSGRIDVHLTICADRGEPFRDEALARVVCESVEFYSTKLGYHLYGYCLMPDHLHVLLSPSASDRPIQLWLREFKSFTTNRFQKLVSQRVLWQRSACDHVCRDEETAENVLAYIVNNPIRNELTARWQDWPWTKVFIEI